MSTNAEYAGCLAALGHETRLAIYRLLTRAGDDGLNVGQIGAHLGQPPSTLAHHLAALVECELVVQERQGRQIINRVDFHVMRGTIAFLTDECCAGFDTGQGNAGEEDAA
ncbi:MAG: winged helix-turn-helix transcriptional regulator [Alphaproteobacteria bacterium]|nr:winged helix-turn-helix transcriptional regulator [Alphaproteobacteria bacterium SS10]